MARHRKIVLVVPNFPYGRQVLKGAQQYMLRHNGWVPYVCMTESEDTQRGRRRLHSVVQQIRPVGVLAVVGPHTRRWFESLDIPVVNAGDVVRTSLPTVRSDSLSIGWMAGRYLLERGLRHFAYGSVANGYFAELRWEGFQEVIQQAGFECDLYDDHYPRRGKSGLMPEASLHAWIGRLPRPLGVFMCYDELALQVIWASQQLGLEVPGEVAVLGGENDEQRCTMWAPALSAVDVPSWRVGYGAMDLLDEMLAGRPAPDAPVLIPPIRIITRTSTDMVSLADDQVARAMQFIRNNAHRPITVKDVLAQVSISRRALERRFARVLGRSPHEEIVLRHMERAKALLVGTDLTVAEVSHSAGFSSQIVFSAAFRKHEGMTPTEHRRRSRGL